MRSRVYKQRMTKQDYIIEVNHVSKRFEDGKLVLDDVSLQVKKGEFVTILGPSGCGKTTLLRCIAGFQVATEGDILLKGEDITQTPPHKRPVNTVFQKYALFPHLNVYDNVAFGLKLKKLDKDTIMKRVKQALKTVGMSDYEFRDVDSLSGGQQQRVAIARAIVNQPEVLLLDEPLAALDLKMRKDMQLELKEMHKKLGITFIYVTHDQEEALTLSDRVVVMSEGKIQQIGTPTDIYNEPVNCFVADFIQEFDCVDTGFGEDAPVDVVIRPEDIYIWEQGAKNNKQEDVDPDDRVPKGNFTKWYGTVETCIFKGVHYEMSVKTENGYEFMVQDYHEFVPGTQVGMLVKPEDIQVMQKERLWNTFDGEMLEGGLVRFLDEDWPVSDSVAERFSPGDKVEVRVPFERVTLLDHEDDGVLAGDVHFILYKGDHYHLTIRTDDGDDIFVDTNDVWDDGDRCGIQIAPSSIRLAKAE